MIFFVARHHTPQNTFTRQAYCGAVEFIEQQDVLGRTTVFAAQTAAFVVAEAVFINQEEADLNT
ncbi:hypothetical protein D3C75_594620 [compost metagenome]